MAGKLDLATKINIIISILNELKRISRINFTVNNISPDTIVLNNEKDQLFFTSFRNARNMNRSHDNYKINYDEVEREYADNITGKVKYL